jgi:hypothetical protein
VKVKLLIFLFISTFIVPNYVLCLTTSAHPLFQVHDLSGGKDKKKKHSRASREKRKLEKAKHKHFIGIQSKNTQKKLKKQYKSNYRRNKLIQQKWQ